MNALKPLALIIGYVWLAAAIGPVIGVNIVWLLVPAVIGFCVYWSHSIE